VYLNGELLWKVSEIARPTGNIWNYSFTIPLSGSLKNVNTLIIKSSALHITGFPSPPYIEEYSNSVSRVNLTNFIFNDFLMFSIGASFILGLLLLLLSLTRKTAPDAAFYMGIAAVTAGVYSYDYCLHRYSCRLEFPILFTVFKFSNFILIANLLIGIFMLMKMVRTKESFLIPMCLLLLSICQVVIDTILSIAGSLSLQYIILVSTIFFSIHILLDFNQIFKENRKLSIGIHKDPLTGDI
jgi:hypothetical protein